MVRPSSFITPCACWAISGGSEKVKKMQSSLAVEGELPEDGLAAYGDDGDDLMMALARKLVLDHDRGIVSGGGEEDEAETVEEVFVLQLTQHPRSGWPGSDRRCCAGRW